MIVVRLVYKAFKIIGKMPAIRSSQKKLKKMRVSGKQPVQIISTKE